MRKRSLLYAPGFGANNCQNESNAEASYFQYARKLERRVCGNEWRVRRTVKVPWDNKECNKPVSTLRVVETTSKVVNRSKRGSSRMKNKKKRGKGEPSFIGTRKGISRVARARKIKGNRFGSMADVKERDDEIDAYLAHLARRRHVEHE